MKTCEEIADHIRERNGELLDFTADALVAFLPFELAREWLKPTVIATDWNPDPLERDVVLGWMRTYMKLAWEKAEDHRGLSAMRSISKMRAWLWAIEDEELVAKCDDEDSYPRYGAPVLAAICAKYIFPIPESPELQRMILGLPCEPRCRQGCR